MASSSAATKKLGGHCVVCGKETHLRCETCSRFGTDFMYFCGEEHQKLIWFLHKKVCGNRSNPFVFPGFVESEIEDILDTHRKSRNTGMTRESLKKKLGKWKEPIDTNLPQSELLKLRAYAHRMRASINLSIGTLSLKDSNATFLKHPVDRLVNSLGNVDIPELATQRSPFMSKFHHLHLVYISIVIANGTALAKGTRPTDTVYASGQIQRLVFENLHPVQPELSNQIIRYFQGVHKQAMQKGIELAEGVENASDFAGKGIRLDQFCLDPRDL
ncbi:hypothetical protein JCM5350_000743 [Sporobolomyces pararoseus]